MACFGSGPMGFSAVFMKLSTMDVSRGPSATLSPSENNGIANPVVENEYLTSHSALFHAHMGFKKVGLFHKCGYKFGRWYNTVWMERLIGEHT